MKIISQRFAANAAREAHILGAVQAHPNIVKLVDVLEDQVSQFGVRTDVDINRFILHSVSYLFDHGAVERTGVVEADPEAQAVH